ARVSTLWGLFDAYRRQLELAEEIRARQFPAPFPTRVRETPRVNA
ncbi:MAG: hypothetical protein JWN00_2472, partial [Actinomycetia bacterium]|nr:hypothetical protein [Actinomycetes bacterium]